MASTVPKSTSVMSRAQIPPSGPAHRAHAVISRRRTSIPRIEVGRGAAAQSEGQFCGRSSPRERAASSQAARSPWPQPRSRIRSDSSSNPSSVSVKAGSPRNFPRAR